MKKLLLFSHHYVTDWIVDRFDNLKKLNPSWDVVPIGFYGYELMDNSLVVNKEKYPCNKELQLYSYYYHTDWFDPDLFIYDGYFQKSDYDEYFLYEYDTACNTSIESFFNTDVDFFGNNIRSPALENWKWVEHYRKLNENNIIFKELHSYGQSTCIYFKNHILKQCAEEVIRNKHYYNNMLSEIRGGTLVNQFTTLKIGRIDIEKYISWKSDDICINDDIYFYHPNKL